MGLSRVRELKNLFIIGNVTPNSVRVDQDTIIEYERLRNEANFFKTHVKKSKQSSLQISLLNTRSFRKHVDDIVKHPVISSSELICLTETQLTDSDTADDIQKKCPNHAIILSNSSDKFCSLAILHDQSMLITNVLSLDGMHLFIVNIGIRPIAYIPMATGLP